MEQETLPAINACLNGAATVLLIFGRRAIAQGKREVHARFMRAAFVFSALFLVGYVTYHTVIIPEFGTTKFRVEGALHTAYLVMLASHVLLAIVNLPMVLWTFWLAHKERWESHKRWAHWTFPIWLYVSVTGVLVYLVLYQWNPPAP